MQYILSTSLQEESWKYQNPPSSGKKVHFTKIVVLLVELLLSWQKIHNNGVDSETELIAKLGENNEIENKKEQKP